MDDPSACDSNTCIVCFSLDMDQISPFSSNGSILNTRWLTPIVTCLGDSPSAAEKASPGSESIFEAIRTCLEPVDTLILAWPWHPGRAKQVLVLAHGERLFLAVELRLQGFSSQLLPKLENLIQVQGSRLGSGSVSGLLVGFRTLQS